MHSFYKWYMSFKSYFGTWLYIALNTHDRPKQLLSMKLLMNYSCSR